MKCWYSELNNPQGSRQFIVVVQLGAVKIWYAAAAVEALRKKERQDETHGLSTMDFWVSSPVEC